MKCCMKKVENILIDVENVETIIGKVLPSELTNTIVCVCMCVCVCACVRACVRAFKRIHVAAYRDPIWHTHADSSPKGSGQSACALYILVASYKCLGHYITDDLSDNEDRAYQ